MVGLALDPGLQAFADQLADALGRQARVSLVHHARCRDALEIGDDLPRRGSQSIGHRLQVGGDPRRARAQRDGDVYRVTGNKAWVTQGGEADFYTLFARTARASRGGISCFLSPGRADGMSFGLPEAKMGPTASTTATVNFDDVALEKARLVGDEGQGLAIALQALDSGRLGVVAVAGHADLRGHESDPAHGDRSPSRAGLTAL